MSRLRAGLLAVIVLLAALFLARERLWAMIRDPYLEPPVDFVSLMPPAWPNRYLVCAPDLCRHAGADRDSPVFRMPARRLRQALLASVEQEIDLQIIEQSQDGYYLRFLQRTPIMRFPDIVAVRVMPIDDESSTLAICSYSLIGFGDMGTNRTRVERWLSRLTG